MTAEKVLENRLRRVAERRGMKLLKSRRRDPGALGYGGYMLVDVETGGAILGTEPRGFSATLDEVEAYFSEQQRVSTRPAADGAPAGRKGVEGAAGGRGGKRAAPSHSRKNDRGK